MFHDVIDVENARALPAQKPSQPGFPLYQRQPAEILSVEVQQVERKEEAFPPSGRYVGDSGRPLFNDLRLVAAVTALGDSAPPSPRRFTDLDEGLHRSESSSDEYDANPFSRLL